MKLKDVALLGFPGYRGRRFRLYQFTEKGVSTNSYWSGGSKNEYVLVNLATRLTEMAPTGSYPWCRDEDRGRVDKLTDDEILCCLYLLKGKPYSVTVYCTPECKAKHQIEGEYD